MARGEGTDVVSLPQTLLDIAALARSRAARQDLWSLSTLLEERGACPWCSCLLTEERDASCPNPNCRHNRELGRPFVRSLG